MSTFLLMKRMSLLVTVVNALRNHSQDYCLLVLISVSCWLLIPIIDYLETTYGPLDSVAKWTTWLRLKQTVMDSIPEVNVNYWMQVHPTDDSQSERNVCLRLHGYPSSNSAYKDLCHWCKHLSLSRNFKQNTASKLVIKLCIIASKLGMLLIVYESDHELVPWLLFNCCRLNGSKFNYFWSKCSFSLLISIITLNQHQWN